MPGIEQVQVKEVYITEIRTGRIGVGIRKREKRMMHIIGSFSIFSEDHKNRILLPSEQNNDPTSINYISDNYKNIDKHNAQVGKTTFRNEMNGENCTNGYSWSLEDVTKEYNCKSMEMTVRQEPQLNQEQNANSNNNNNNCKMTAFSISDVFDYNDDDIYEDDMRISRKVRRCFGKTVCMPQTLLCFKVWLVCSFHLIAQKYTFSLIHYTRYNSYTNLGATRRKKTFLSIVVY